MTAVPIPLDVTGQDLEYMYKKTLGVSYEFPGSATNLEPQSSLPFIFNTQIMANTVPPTAPSISGTGTPLTDGGTRYSTSDQNIFYYEYLPLNTNINGNNLSFKYSSQTYTTLNASQAIPSTYGSGYTLAIYFDQKSTSSVPSSQSNMTWIFDTSTGAVTFTTNTWNSIYSTPDYPGYPYISFYRYEGTFGTNSGGEWSQNGNNIYYNTGNVGIGTNNPSSTLDVSGNFRISGVVDSGNSADFIYLNDDISVNGGAIIRGSKAVIGKSSYSNYNLDVSGNAIFSGQVLATSFQSSSDYRLKNNIKQIDNNYSVDNLNPVEYDMDNKHNIGFIAHEVQEYYPFLVDGEKDGEMTQSINYNGFIGLLVKEIQELKKEIKDLKQKIN